MLDEALAEAGIPREEIYLTNACCLWLRPRMKRITRRSSGRKPQKNAVPLIGSKLRGMAT